MTTIGVLAMLAAAVGSLGCVLAARPRQVGGVLASVIMLVAMVDMAIGHRLLPPIGWAALLIAVGVFVVALPRAAEASCSWQHGVALVAAAVIMISSPHAEPLAMASGPDHAGHLVSSTSYEGGWLTGLLVAGGYAAVVLGQIRPLDRLHVAQVVSTTTCLAVMALLGLSG